MSMASPTKQMSLLPLLRNSILVFVIIGIVVFFRISEGEVFTSARNFTYLIQTLSYTAIAALGLLPIILLAHIDLAVGSAMGLAGSIAAVCIYHLGWPAPLAMGIAILAGVACYAVMGFLVAWQKVPSFIMTLAGMFVFKGAFLLVLSSETVSVKVAGQANVLSVLSSWFFPAWAGYLIAGTTTAAIFLLSWRNRITSRRYHLPTTSARLWLGWNAGVALVAFGTVYALNHHRGLPLPLVILAGVATVVWVITQHTRFGRWCYAIGGNAEAAHLSGVPVKRVILGTFLLAGFTACVAGFLQAAYTGSVSSTAGFMVELDAIAACVIGGVSLTGGRGSVPGVLIGATLMVTLIHGMGTAGVSVEHKYIARGLVLALAVWIDVRFRGN